MDYKFNKSNIKTHLIKPRTTSLPVCMVSGLFALSLGAARARNCMESIQYYKTPENQENNAVFSPKKKAIFINFTCSLRDHDFCSSKRRRHHGCRKW